LSYDVRITPAHDGLTSRALEGVVRAKVFVEPTTMSVVIPAAGIRSAPRPDAEQVDQVLFGESFEVIETLDGYVWGQARRDGYVGFVEAAALGPESPLATHRVAAIRTYAFAEPSIKARALGPYSINSLVAETAREGRFVQAHGGAWFVTEHLAPVGRFETDPAAVAERFLGAPYLWGGRESLGLDCSGLVQQALFACGRACPRDTDQQRGLGDCLDPIDLKRGDLIFWRGHVAMMLDGSRIIHANAHHMAVATESLAAALARIGATSVGEPVSYRRPMP
jgi:cell wall-associated NlpC family hydrolase